jgi:outer membrane protein assembly factor BamB
MILILVGVLALPSVVSAQGEVLFGCTSDNESMLYELDPATGAGTLIGDMGIGWCSALAFDSGNLFATGWENVPDWTNSLYLVDPATGATTRIGGTGYSDDGPITDMSFRSDETLFGVLHRWGAGNDRLVTLNTATGAATVMGDTGMRRRGNSLAFHPSDVLFYSGNRELYVLNQTNGDAAWVADLNVPNVVCPYEPRINAMDFTSTGILFGVMNCGAEDEPMHYLVTIEESGNVNVIGRTVDRLDGIVFVPLPPPPEPEFVPEWGSIALLGGGLMGLAGYASLRWRKR